MGASNRKAGGGLGYVPTATRVPFGNAGGTGLTESPDFTFDDALNRLRVGGAGANIRADATSGNPHVALYIAGSEAFTMFADAAGTGAVLYSLAQDLYVQTVAAKDLIFRPQGAESVRLLPGGAIQHLTRPATFIHKHSVAFSHTDFDALGAADTSETLNLGAALPANARIEAINIKLATAFSGGGNGSLTLDIGSAGDPDALVDGANLFAAPVDGQASTAPNGIAPDKHFSASTQLTGTFVCDVGLQEFTAGAGTIEILYSILS